MNFKQFLKLNEMYVKENGRDYFISYVQQKY